MREIGPEVFAHPHVVLDGSSPMIEGTAIPVRRIWRLHQSGCPIATIMARYHRIGPGAILSALAFAYDNKDLVERDLHEAAGGRTVGDF